MSGYNPRTGIFQLNSSKARRYLRQPFDPSVPANNILQYAAEILRRNGLEVIKVDEYCVYVVADDAQIWETLSERPSVWGKAKGPPAQAYRRYQERREWFNATDIGKALSPAISAIRVNQLLAEMGFQVKTRGVWEPTSKAKGLHTLVGARNEYAYLNKQPPHSVIKWRRGVIDLLARGSLRPSVEK